MQRISVVGNSGSGKTTIARQLAAHLLVPHLELDSIFHLPGWQQLPDEQFRDRVETFVAQPGWVIDGNYRAVQDLVWARADTVVWFDLPRRVVMQRVTARTVGRLISRRELWNGNREKWSSVLTRDPARSILAWAWTKHHHYRERYLRAMADPANSHLAFVVIRTAADVDRLLATDH